jgi:hypothetical protein
MRRTPHGTLVLALSISCQDTVTIIRLGVTVGGTDLDKCDPRSFESESIAWPDPGGPAAEAAASRVRAPSLFSGAPSQPGCARRGRRGNGHGHVSHGGGSVGNHTSTQPHGSPSHWHAASGGGILVTRSLGRREAEARSHGGAMEAEWWLAVGVDSESRCQNDKILNFDP